MPPPSLGCGSVSSWMPLGGLLEAFSGFLGSLGGLSGASRGPLGKLFGAPGAPWGLLGALEGHLGTRGFAGPVRYSSPGSENFENTLISFQWFWFLGKLCGAPPRAPGSAADPGISAPSGQFRILNIGISKGGPEDTPLSASRHGDGLALSHVGGPDPSRFGPQLRPQGLGEAGH